MRNRILQFSVISLLLIGVLLAPNACADEWDKRTIFTFSEPVQVSGVVLPAGTYVFKLMDIQGDRNLVQIFDANENHLFATIVAIPEYRTEVSDKTIVTLEESFANQPKVLQSWFYPGDNYGREFVYPKPNDEEFAPVDEQSAPTVLAEVTEPKVPENTALPPVAETSTEAVDETPTPTTSDNLTLSATAVELEQLPQTASPLVSIALLGILCLAGAATLRGLGRPIK
jgi:hypothetical protein